MGDVYLATDSLLGGDERIALKILHPQLCRDERHSKRFLREVQLTRKVTHQNVIRTYDVGHSDGRLYFTMEYVEGRPLSEIIAEGPIRYEMACEITKAVCHGLDAIHAVGIIHRDLKPANIIILKSGDVKIADFGVARAGYSNLTRDNEIVGSAPYMPPELWLGREIGPASDLYALGVILYEMVTGILPFDGDSAPELMAKHLETTPPSPYELNSAVPQGFSALVLSLLQKSPEKRPDSIQTFLAQMELMSRDDQAIDDSSTSFSGYIPSHSFQTSMMNRSQDFSSSVASSRPLSSLSIGINDEITQVPHRLIGALKNSGAVLFRWTLGIVFASAIGSGIFYLLTLWVEYYHTQTSGDLKGINILSCLLASTLLGALPLCVISGVRFGVIQNINTVFRSIFLSLLFGVTALWHSGESVNVSPQKIFGLSRTAADTVTEIATLTHLEVGSFSPRGSFYHVDNESGRPLVIRTYHPPMIALIRYYGSWLAFAFFGITILQSAARGPSTYDTRRAHPIILTLVAALPMLLYWALRIVVPTLAVGSNTSFEITLGTVHWSSDIFSLIASVATWIIIAIASKPISE